MKSKLSILALVLLAASGSALADAGDKFSDAYDKYSATLEEKGVDSQGQGEIYSALSTSARKMIAMGSTCKDVSDASKIIVQNALTDNFTTSEMKDFSNDVGEMMRNFCIVEKQS